MSEVRNEVGSLVDCRECGKITSIGDVFRDSVLAVRKSKDFRIEHARGSDEESLVAIHSLTSSSYN
jgi:hypothetical protein